MTRLPVWLQLLQISALILAPAVLCGLGLYYSGRIG